MLKKTRRYPQFPSQEHLLANCFHFPDHYNSLTVYWLKQVDTGMLCKWKQVSGGFKEIYIVYCTFLSMPCLSVYHKHFNLYSVYSFFQLVPASSLQRVYNNGHWFMVQRHANTFCTAQGRAVATGRETVAYLSRALAPVFTPLLSITSVCP